MLPSDKPRGPDRRGGIWWGSWAAVGDQRLRLEATSRKMTGEVGVDEVPEERATQNWETPRQRAERWAGCGGSPERGETVLWGGHRRKWVCRRRCEISSR